MTVSEMLYIGMIDILNFLNRFTIRRSVMAHDCESQHIQCDMLEREYGAPRRTIINERRQRGQA